MVKTIFNFDDYRSFIVEKIKSSPGGGKGELKRIAEALGVHGSLLSQILRGSKKNLSVEQGFLISKHFGLTSFETRYFIGLVNRDRAGTLEFKKYVSDELERMRQESQDLKGQTASDHPLSELNQAIFYSNWYYAGIHLLTTISENQTVGLMAKRLKLSDDLVTKAVAFLLEAGLCEEKAGFIRATSRRTHIGSDSPLVGRHHMNWRFKGMEGMSHTKPHELFFTFPMSIAKSDSDRIRALLTNVIKEVNDIVAENKEEKVSCLNIDWFDF